jgi:hypothetical protein
MSLNYTTSRPIRGLLRLCGTNTTTNQNFKLDATSDTVVVYVDGALTLTRRYRAEGSNAARDLEETFLVMLASLALRLSDLEA